MRLLNGTDWPYRKENVQARYFFVETFQNKERKKKAQNERRKKKKRLIVTDRERKRHFMCRQFGWVGTRRTVTAKKQNKNNKNS